MQQQQTYPLAFPLASPLASHSLTPNWLGDALVTVCLFVTRSQTCPSLPHRTGHNRPLLPLAPISSSPSHAGPFNSHDHHDLTCARSHWPASRTCPVSRGQGLAESAGDFPLSLPKHRRPCPSFMFIAKHKDPISPPPHVLAGLLHQTKTWFK